MASDLPRLTPSPSIYEFLAARADELGRLPDDVILPDEPDRDGGIRWAPGALDGVLGHHAGRDDANVRARELAGLVAEAAEHPSVERLRALLDGCGDDAIAIVDPMIERLVERQPPRDGIRRVARWLASTATERAPVKVGIALLGVAGVDGSDGATGILRTLGAHHEFTLFVSVAFANGAGDGAESEIWAQAATVDGWGRIQCVERLRDTTDPAIKRWILRTGFRNSVMYEYLAYIAATTGGLLEALRGEVDRELLDAAGEIFEALVMGGPAEDLDDWDEGADAVEAYLAVMATRAATIRDYLGVAAIRKFLARDEDWDERAERGWTAGRRTAFATACREVLARPHWADVAWQALESSDRAVSWSANAVLADLGADTFEHHVDAIRADPHAGNWFDAWRQARGDRPERLVRLARELLPLDAIGAGGAVQPGHGLGSPDHMALDWTLQELRHHPGLGGDLLLVGLGSAVVRNRNMALQALQVWPTDRWPDGVRPLLAAIAADDDHESTRAQAAELSQR